MPNQIILFYDDNDAADDDVGDDVDDKNVEKLNNVLTFCHHEDSRFWYKFFLSLF